MGCQVAIKRASRRPRVLEILVCCIADIDCKMIWLICSLPHISRVGLHCEYRFRSLFSVRVFCRYMLKCAIIAD